MSMDDENQRSLPSLKRSISPPATSRNSKRNKVDHRPRDKESALAAVEAGRVVIEDHVQYFSKKLARFRRPPDLSSDPRLSLDSYVDLYVRNQRPNGHHFVVHQHQHPVAGVHFLTDEFSFVCHPVWSSGQPKFKSAKSYGYRDKGTLRNHLIESASHATGSLLIWDTGEYEVLPRYAKAPETDDELPDDSENSPEIHENAKLIAAFHDRHIRLRLHGTRLPESYTVYMRLPLHNDIEAAQRRPAQRRRRQHAPARQTSTLSTSSSSDHDTSANSTSGTPSSSTLDDDAVANASDDESSSATIVSTNSYPGATNSIGSVHQRRWFVSLDRSHSGFIRPNSGTEKGRWVRGGNGTTGFEPFFVRGREVERSILTGRLAREVLADEGVKGFVERKMWRPILE